MPRAWRRSKKCSRNFAANCCDCAPTSPGFAARSNLSPPARRPQHRALRRARMRRSDRCPPAFATGAATGVRMAPSPASPPPLKALRPKRCPLPTPAQSLASAGNRTRCGSSPRVRRRASSRAPRKLRRRTGRCASRRDQSRARTDKNFLANWWKHATRWEMDGGEVRSILSHREPRCSRKCCRRATPWNVCAHRQPQSSASRCASVLNWRQCRSAERSASRQARELRARFEQDPIVRAMLERFGGQISDVKRRGEE